MCSCRFCDCDGSVFQLRQASACTFAPGSAGEWSDRVRIERLAQDHDHNCTTDDSRKNAIGVKKADCNLPKPRRVPESMKDRFSNHASQYAAFRPSYPKALYDFILSHTRGRDAAWDCACGNGQVAKDLSPRFKRVYATDVSQKQLDNAVRRDNIEYSLSPAEKTTFPDESFDLMTVGQALHWFRISDFFLEVKRVGRPGSTVAAWGYGLLRINNQINPILHDFYVNIVGPFWDPERRLIDEHYRSIEFPFTKIVAPDFEFSFDWTLDELCGYLKTWSAVQKFIEERKHNPVDDLFDRLLPLWNGRRKIDFPLFLLLGRL